MAWKSKFRLISLLVALLLVLLYAYNGAVGERIFLAESPRCNVKVPVWAGAIKGLSEELDFGAVQVSFIDPHGRMENCEIGSFKIGLLRVPLRPYHTFRYASLSKLFTAYVIHRQIRDGRIGLDEKLLSHVDISEKFDERLKDIELHHLLSHTSGLGPAVPDPMLSPEPWCPDRLDLMGKLKLHSAPGSRFAYSNLGYCLLGMVSEKLDGRKFTESVENIFLERDGDVQITAIADFGWVANEVRPEFDTHEGIGELFELHYPSMRATGSWAGNAASMNSFIRGHFVGAENGEILGDMLSTAVICEKTVWRGCHASGFYIYSENNNYEMYWRDGSLPGYSTFAALFENGASIVILANHRKFDWIKSNDSVGKHVYRVFANQGQN